jgi:hypothetical protein
MIADLKKCDNPPGEDTNADLDLQVHGKRSTEQSSLCVDVEHAPKKKRVRVRKSKRAKIIEKSVASGRKLLVFDLNGVLIHRTSLSDFVLRPGAINLLQFLSSRCDLAIWSSAKKDTVKRIYRSMFSSSALAPKDSFIFVWNQNQCTINETEQDAGKPSFLKEISQILKQYPQFDYDGGCFLIDDSISKLRSNPPSSSICVPTYSGEASDIELLPGGSIYELLSNLTSKL